MAKLDQIEINGTPYELVPEIAPLFNTSTAYAIGDYVIKDATMYRFKTAHTAGAWNASQVDEVTVGSEIKDIKQATSEIDTLKADLSNLQAEIEGGGSGLTADLKAALDQLAQKVAYIDADGQDYYDALHAALYPPAHLTRISCVYTQSGTVYDTYPLDSLKSDLVVTAHFSDSTTQTVTTYTLSGTLAEGTSTITVAYGGKTTTFSVTVTEWQLITQTIAWSGYGADQTSTIVDATQYDAYFELPFVDGATELVSEATSSMNAFKVYDTYLYSDLECTTQVGRYHVATGEIGQTGKSATSHAFDTKLKVVPQGYYAKLLLNKIPTAFDTNADFQSYLNNYAGTVTLE